MQRLKNIVYVDKFRPFPTKLPNLFFFRCDTILKNKKERKMEIKSKVSKNTLIIDLNGELDECTANYTRSVMDDLIMENKFNKVIVDMHNLEFMDSTGIGVLIGRYKKLKSKNVFMYVANPNSHIEKIFKMSGLFEIIPKIS